MRKKYDDENSIVNDDAEVAKKYEHLGNIDDKMHAKIYYHDGKEYCNKFFKSKEKLVNFLDGLNMEIDDDTTYFYAIIQ